MIWDALVKIALIGTDRSELPAHEKAKLESIGIDTSTDAAKYILEAAAFYTPIRKAGFVLKEWQQKFPTPAPTEQLQIASPKTIRHLSLILSGRYALAITELLNLMRSYNKCLPYSLLPQLLSNCKSNPILWKLIKPIIGQRGWWLIEQNQDWHFLKKESPDIDWSLASVEQKVGLLKLVRQKEAPLAIELLQTSWEEESVKDKVKFLKTLQIGLSKKDEQFLEQCLDHKRKEIRLQAITLLSSLAHSDFSQRMFERAKSLLSLKKDKIVIELNIGMDETAIRDGLEPLKSKASSNNKFPWLVQIFSAVPPQRWESHFDKSTEEIISLFGASNRPMILIEALAIAAVNFKNEKWITNILHFYLKSSNSSYRQTGQSISKHPNLSILINALNEKNFNRIAFDLLKKEKQLPAEESLLIKLLIDGKRPWSDQLVLLFFNDLQNWLSSSSANYWDGNNYRKVLKQAAYKCNPKLLPKLKNLAEAAGRTWAGWEKDLEQFIRTIRFRKEMLEEIKS